MTHSKSGERFKANVRAGEYHLRLKVEHTPTGWVATVAERKGDTEVDRKMVDSAEAGKKHAEEVAKRYLANQDVEIPAILWTRIGIGRGNFPRRHNSDQAARRASKAIQNDASSHDAKVPN